MILEIATLDIKPEATAKFEAAFPAAVAHIAGSKGYIAHELQRCVEQKDRYKLFVWWKTLKDHTEGFRNAPAFQEWRSAIGQHFAAPPSVEHYAKLLSGGTRPE